MNHRHRLLAIIALAATTLGGGCQSDHSPHWGYEGDVGPEHWAELDSNYVLAAEGREQSPVDLGRAETRSLVDVEYHYVATPVDLVNTGHSIQFDYDRGSSVRLGLLRYQLVQLHFHSPSEHTVDGRSFDLEMHLVHQDEDGDLAVVGVLIEEGAHNRWFEPLWAAMPEEAGGRRHLPNVLVTAERLLPDDRRYYAYRGSLTTPPCSEGVKWIVLREPLQMSAAQIAEFRAIYEGNNRPVQPLNDRVIMVDE